MISLSHAMFPTGPTKNNLHVSAYYYMKSNELVDDCFL